jgi:hypothetical protein
MKLIEMIRRYEGIKQREKKIEWACYSTRKRKRKREWESLDVVPNNVVL